MKTEKILCFTENDLYTLTFINGDDEYEVVVVGEKEAHRHFEYICKEKIHQEVILSKGKIVKHANNCVCANKEIRRWKRSETIDGTYPLFVSHSLK